MRFENRIFPSMPTPGAGAGPSQLLGPFGPLARQPITSTRAGLGSPSAHPHPCPRASSSVSSLSPPPLVPAHSRPLIKLRTEDSQRYKLNLLTWEVGKLGLSGRRWEGRLGLSPPHLGSVLSACVCQARLLHHFLWEAMPDSILWI